jgi:hypothetical protein
VCLSDRLLTELGKKVDPWRVDLLLRVIAFRAPPTVDRLSTELGKKVDPPRVDLLLRVTAFRAPPQALPNHTRSHVAAVFHFSYFPTHPQNMDSLLQTHQKIDKVSNPGFVCASQSRDCRGSYRGGHRVWGRV